MAFKVGSFEDVTIIGITDPYLAAAIRRFGRYWEEVKDLPESAPILAQAIDSAEDMAAKAAAIAAEHQPPGAGQEPRRPPTTKPRGRH